MPAPLMMCCARFASLLQAFSLSLTIPMNDLCFGAANLCLMSFIIQDTLTDNSIEYLMM